VSTDVESVALLQKSDKSKEKIKKNNIFFTKWEVLREMVIWKFLFYGLVNSIPISEHEPVDKICKDREILILLLKP